MYTADFKISIKTPTIIHYIEHNMIPEKFRNYVYDIAVNDYYNHENVTDCGDFWWCLDFNELDKTDEWVQWLFENLPEVVVNENKFAISFSQ